MNTCAELFTNNLDQKNLRYTVREIEDRVIVTFSYQNLTTLVIFAGDDGDHAQLQTIIEHVPEDKTVDVILVCNQLNAQYRYVKFVVDKDNDVLVYTDAILDTSSADEEAFELLIRSIQIIGDAKPAIMRAIYS